MNEDSITYTDQRTFWGTAEMADDEKTGIFYASNDAWQQETSNRSAILTLEAGDAYVILTGNATYPVSMTDNRVSLPFRVESKIEKKDEEESDFEGGAPFFVG